MVPCSDTPMPVADSVPVVYRDRYIYLISGWSTTDAVRAVQIYDVEKQVWLQGTAIPGEPVFGHAGTIVVTPSFIVDGVRKNPSGGSPGWSPRQIAGWATLTTRIRQHIEWTKLPDHPGTARFPHRLPEVQRKMNEFISPGQRESLQLQRHWRRRQARRTLRPSPLPSISAPVNGKPSTRTRPTRPWIVAISWSLREAGDCWWSGKRRGDGASQRIAEGDESKIVSVWGNGLRSRDMTCYVFVHEN